MHDSVADPSPECLFLKSRDDADPEAFRIVVERTRPGLTDRARRLGIAAADLDDVIQETYLAAWRGAHRFDPTRRFAGWLVGILRNKAADARRNLDRHNQAPANLYAARRGDPPERPEVGELVGALRQAMSKLPPRDRDILKRRFEQRVKAETIARELGVPPSTVRSVIWRSLRRLRSTMHDYGRGHGLIVCAARRLGTPDQGQ
ncbi:MAG: sigma-70 family RNA polymerase sigma factor [Planctomycetota bacterium]